MTDRGPINIVPQQPVHIGGLEEREAYRTAQLANPQASPSTPEAWLAQQQAEGRAFVEDRQAAIEAATSRKLEEQQELEGRHGKVGTAALQFGRGALDVILAPGALVGLQLEGTGELAGWDGLRDFGREFGRSAQGDELLATLPQMGTALASVFGDPDAEQAREDISDYERHKTRIQEQEEAWPMLSTTSRLAGGVAAGVGLGGAAGGGAKLATTAAVSAYEGAAYGAQSGYAQNASLRDVLSSTLIGAAVGGAVPAGMHGSGKALSRAGKALPTARQIADESALKAIGARGTDLRKLVGRKTGEAAEAKMATVGQDLLGYEFKEGGGKLFRAGMKAEDLVEGITKAKREVGAELGSLRGTVAELPSDLAAYLKKVDDDVLAELKSSTSPTMRARAVKVEDELAALRDGKIRTLGELEKVRKDLRTAFQPPKPASGGLPAPVSEHAEYLERAERMLADHIDDATGKALTGEGAARHKELKRLYSSFSSAEDISRKAALQDLGNRGVSLTDYMTGLTAGGVGGIPAGIASTAAHKLLRERGRSVLAVVADKLAGRADDAVAHANPLEQLFGKVDDAARHVVSLEEAGGREAQTVIAELHRARKLASEAAQAAGDNPQARNVAVREATEQLRGELSKKTGPFNPASWRAKGPTPLQKVFHRTEILDRVAGDVSQLAAAAPRAGTFRVDPRKLKKLLGDADGPAAIGSLQQRLKQALNEVPKTADGDALWIGLSDASAGLSTASLPEAMQQGHQLAQKLMEAAAASPDDLVRNYAKRQARAFMDALSGEAFGSAGRVYREAAADAAPRFLALSEPKLVREALRTAEVRGKLGGVVREHAEQVARAADAQAALGGVKAKGLAKELRELETLVAQAEEAVTLDGGPVGRVLEFFKNRVEDRVHGAVGTTDVGGIVAKYVRPKMETVLAHAKGHSSWKHTAKHTAEHAAEHTATHVAESKAIKAGMGERAAAAVATRGAQQTLYADRLAALQQVAIGGDSDAVEEGVSAIDQIAPGLGAHAAADMTEKMGNLLRDMPKPEMGIRGPKIDSLSSEELRLSTAMWEATMEPMSVFDDFASGVVDYDKVQYAWQQYPGLQQAAQMGLMDIVQTHLSDEEFEGLPEATITQLDNLFGMEGALQPTVKFDFALRITQGAEAEAKGQQQKPPPMAAMKTPASQPTFTARLAGHR